jgi:hypothetical protein
MIRKSITLSFTDGNGPDDWLYWLNIHTHKYQSNLFGLLPVATQIPLIIFLIFY